VDARADAQSVPYGRTAVTPDYCYNAQVTRIIDADTVEVRVDVGFRMWAEMPMRLAGINAPEKYTDAGKVATNALTDQLGSIPSDVVVKTIKPVEKYGRYLGVLFKDEVNLNEWLINFGYAVPYLEGK